MSAVLKFILFLGNVLSYVSMIYVRRQCNLFPKAVHIRIEIFRFGNTAQNPLYKME